jgi:hypothetical protein
MGHGGLENLLVFLGLESMIGNLTSCMNSVKIGFMKFSSSEGDDGNTLGVKSVTRHNFGKKSGLKKIGIS